MIKYIRNYKQDNNTVVSIHTLIALTKQSTVVVCSVLQSSVVYTTVCFCLNHTEEVNVSAWSIREQPVLSLLLLSPVRPVAMCLHEGRPACRSLSLVGDCTAELPAHYTWCQLHESTVFIEPTPERNQADLMLHHTFWILLCFHPQCIRFRCVALDVKDVGAQEGLHVNWSLGMFREVQSL